MFDLCLGHPTAHAAAATALMRSCHLLNLSNDSLFGLEAGSSLLRFDLV